MAVTLILFAIARFRLIIYNITWIFLTLLHLYDTLFYSIKYTLICYIIEVMVIIYISLYTPPLPVL